MNGSSTLGLEHQLVDADVCFLLRSSTNFLLAHNLTSSTCEWGLCYQERSLDHRGKVWACATEKKDWETSFWTERLRNILLSCQHYHPWSWSWRKRPQKESDSRSWKKTMADSNTRVQRTSNLLLRQRSPPHRLSIHLLLSDGKLQEMCLKICPDYCLGSFYGPEPLRFIK